MEEGEKEEKDCEQEIVRKGRERERRKCLCVKVCVEVCSREILFSAANVRDC